METEGEGHNLTIRLESLSDLVFGLALSIGALLLAISGVNTSAQLESNIVTFGFSFLILIFVWVRYTAVMADLPLKLRQKGLVRQLNYILLFLVAIEPYLFNILHTITSNDVLRFASSLYALDIGFITLILAILISILVSYDMKSHRKLTVSERYLYMRGGFFSMSLIMIVSAIPIFWHIEIFGTHARFFMWIVILPLMGASLWLRRTHKRVTQNKRQESA